MFAQLITVNNRTILILFSDIFLPCPDNLLINLKENKELILDLLQQLPNRFEKEHDQKSALGSALQAAFKMMVNITLTLYDFGLPT